MDAGPMFKTVVLALDGSQHADRALETVLGLARHEMIETVHLVHVIAPRAPEVVLAREAYVEIEHAYVATVDFERSVGFEMLHEASRRLKLAGLDRIEEHVLVGEPADAILDLANRTNADLVVLGRRGLGAFSGLLQGSVTRKVEHAAQCPVLTVV